MCGVVGVVGHKAELERALAGVTASRHRGPDDEGVFVLPEAGVALGHARLSIQDLDHRSACPFTVGGATLVYNGELWNADQVRAEIAGSSRYGAERTYRTTGDTEVFATAVDQWDAETALSMMEGMFAAAWWDEDEESVYLARDRFGEVPLHVCPLGAEMVSGPGFAVSDGFAFASELKVLQAMGCDVSRAAWVGPGEVVQLTRTATGRWRAVTRRWYAPPADPVPMTLPDAGVRMRGLMAQACAERAVSDVPVCTLLSGGIDSTAVAYHLREHFHDLVAFTAVFNPKSQDARMARLAADRLGIELVEVVVPLPTEADLRDVVRRIEMPFKAQIEIGWPCLHLARAMQERGFKVCFSGEGSDELWASYGFAYHVLQRTFGGRKVFGAPGAVYEQGKEREWCEYRRDTFVAQSRKNFPRCNKVFMAHGVECRLPFLHTPLVEFALSVPVDVCVVRQPGRGPTKQKAVMYEAWDGLVPDEIVRRHKVAFQEGMGLKDAIADAFGATNPKVFYNAAYKEAYA